MPFLIVLKAAVLEDALDGVQDNPVLSTGSSRTSPRTGSAGGAPGDGGNDGSVQRLESLRELLDAALYHRPDLPLQLCVKSETSAFYCEYCVLTAAVQLRCMYRSVLAYESRFHFEI